VVALERGISRESGEARLLKHILMGANRNIGRMVCRRRR
jgi:hypothetical protein